MRIKKLLSLLACLPLLMVAACQDDFSDDDVLSGAEQDDASLFWRTGELTRAQQLELNRSYGIGFSYDAIYGGKCDPNAFRCQVLNLTALGEGGMYSDIRMNLATDTMYTTRSISEYCHVMNITSNVSGDVLIYSADMSKVSALYEFAWDTVNCFYDKYQLMKRRLDVPTIYSLEEEDFIPESYLTPSFLYGIEKIKRTPINNTLAVDSFINIFGTHVVTQAQVGASLEVTIQSRKALFKDYKSETTLTKEKINLLFAKTESETSQTEQSFLTQVLDNSTVEMKAAGGKVSILNPLVTNPKRSNTAASETTLNAWKASLQDNEETNQGNLVMVDMAVTPIWDFIPDKTVALRVKARIQADAPTMQQLFGNRNWVNTRIKLNPGTFTNYWSSGSKQQSYDASTVGVINVVAANRIVATICREWIPEAPFNGQVAQVFYPVYENQVDLASGLSYYNNKVYRVAWLYNQFIVEEIPDEQPSDYVYLSFGCLNSTPLAGQIYLDAHYLVGYEWPGSINALTGNVASSGYVLTRKFLGDFYLENGDQYSNLPNWSYETVATTNYAYDDLLRKNTPYDIGGIRLSGRSGYDNLKNRMVRNANYRYYLNKKECWYEK